ncbi:hypothetical protein KOI35_15775 [Actinoplanes bogorensis]|uniref:Leucine rich repeat (LRR) protein n=1 Tax=Paractinoplanes bogorensis TaxID=1610840 RepID=A0ABS5YNC1_9ACTN|nr:hypothetical protein [Actinoplanes bogorensis]MBU2664962.1 hypothetical protein [Actinoplanes bogorensis]
MAGRTSVAERVAAAQRASVESLAAYAGDSSPAVRRAVAARPDASGDVLRALIADRDLATRAAVAGNPGVPEDVLITLLTDRHWRVRLTAARNPAATPAARRAMCAAADPNVRLVLAQQPGLPAEIGAALARDEFVTVREALAACTDSPAVVAALLADPDGRIRGAAGINSLVTVPQLQALRHDTHRQARLAVVWANHRRAEVPVDDLLALARDRSFDVRYWLANLAGATREVYEILAHDRDEMVSTTARLWLLPPDDPRSKAGHRTGYPDPARLGEPTPFVAATPDELMRLLPGT